VFTVPVRTEPRIPLTPPKGGSGGTARPNAMDIAAGAATSGNLTGVAGTAGGPAMSGTVPRGSQTSAGYGGSLRPPPGGRPTLPAGLPKTPGPGSGGSNMVNSQTNSPASSNSSARFQPITKLKIKPSTGVDHNFDYGGCSTCNSKKDDLVVR
jgi:hypothetical protein